MIYLREDKSIFVQKKKLEKKLKKAERKYDKAGPAKRIRLLKEGKSVMAKLEKIDSILGD